LAFLLDPSTPSSPSRIACDRRHHPASSHRTLWATIHRPRPQRHNALPRLKPHQRHSRATSAIAHPVAQSRRGQPRLWSGTDALPYPGSPCVGALAAPLPPVKPAAGEGKRGSRSHHPPPPCPTRPHPTASLPLPPKFSGKIVNPRPARLPRLQMGHFALKSGKSSGSRALGSGAEHPFMPGHCWPSRLRHQLLRPRAQQEPCRIYLFLFSCGLPHTSTGNMFEEIPLKAFEFVCQIYAQ
jgi:hypothetical protein